VVSSLYACADCLTRSQVALARFDYQQPAAVDALCAQAVHRRSDFGRIEAVGAYIREAVTGCLPGNWMLCTELVDMAGKCVRGPGGAHAMRQATSGVARRHAVGAGQAGAPAGAAAGAAAVADAGDNCTAGGGESVSGRNRDGAAVAVAAARVGGAAASPPVTCADAARPGVHSGCEATPFLRPLRVCWTHYIAVAPFQSAKQGDIRNLGLRTKCCS